MTIVYLAYPIDSVAVDQRQELDNMVGIAKHILSGDEGVTVFDPKGAWFGKLGKADARLQQVNEAALDRADVVLALLPKWASSIGVPVEIYQAAKCGVQVYVVRDHLSYALAAMGPNVHIFSTVQTAAYALLEARDQRPVARAYATYEPITGAASRPVAPSKAHEDDAGFDLFYSGAEPMFISPGCTVDVPASVKIQWPTGIWALLIGRSSSLRSRDLLVNASVIDPGYRGTMFAVTRNIGDREQMIKPGERIAQLVPLPAVAASISMFAGLVDEGTRGDNGFGSSGL